MKKLKRILLSALVLTAVIAVIWCISPQILGTGSTDPTLSLPSISGISMPTLQNSPDENASYTKKDDVALYLHVYGQLPPNFITKTEARALGWQGGGLDGFADGKSIGGDRFGNYEELLPDKDGRVWYECDIDTMHKNERGTKRIVFSNDGLIYYTSDHYNSFTQLY